MADRARRVNGSTDTEVRPAKQPAAEEPRTRRLRLPSALTVLALILVAMWVASFFIPSGVYELDEAGAPVPGTYRELPRCDEAAEEELCADKSLSAQFDLLWRAPPNGLYGIEDPSTRIVSADASTPSSCRWPWRWGMTAWSPSASSPWVRARERSPPR